MTVFQFVGYTMQAAGSSDFAAKAARRPATHPQVQIDEARARQLIDEFGPAAQIIVGLPQDGNDSYGLIELRSKARDDSYLYLNLVVTPQRGGSVIPHKVFELVAPRLGAVRKDDPAHQVAQLLTPGVGFRFAMVPPELGFIGQPWAVMAFVFA